MPMLPTDKLASDIIKGNVDSVKSQVGYMNPSVARPILVQQINSLFGMGHYGIAIDLLKTQEIKAVLQKEDAQKLIQF